jgi:acetylornithine deacetylase/succinyl-diaminopimelate desuccinylase-like protein
MKHVLLLFLSMVGSLACAQTPRWSDVEKETLEHFQALLRIDTSDPPGHEAPAVDYLKRVLEREGIEVEIFAVDPKRPNLVARLRGSGKKRPLLIMAHTDVVNVDPTKWIHPPFAATRADDGFIYGRGAIDDKDNVTAGLMTLLLLKRQRVQLDRDVIFLAEAGEEGNVRFGIKFMTEQHWPKIEAEYCLAEGGGVVRAGGKIEYAQVATTEKVATGLRLVAHGPSGHGSIPLRGNAIGRLSQAIGKVEAWQTPMRLNETTRAFFERLARISPAEEAARYRSLLSGQGAEVAQEYLAINLPALHSMLRTSISPNMIQGGYRINVIPSQAEATLDVRLLPDDDKEKLMAQLRTVIGDSQVEVLDSGRDSRPVARSSRLDSEAFRLLEAAHKRIYGAVTLPSMLNGATDMAFVRAKDVDCYGVGPVSDREDALKGFGAHGDQERLSEKALHDFVRLHWEFAAGLASRGR